LSVNSVQDMSRTCRPQQSLRRRGFTLIELIATIAIVGALGSIAASILFASVNGLTNSTTSAQLHTEMSVALDVIDRELRQVSIDSGASDIAPNIDSVTATTISWNGDDKFLLDGTQLKWIVDGGDPVVLLQDVTEFTVTAFDESNAQMGATLSGTGCDNIRRILVEVTASRNGVTEKLRTKVFVRCAVAGPES